MDFIIELKSFGNMQLNVIPIITRKSLCELEITGRIVTIPITTLQISCSIHRFLKIRTDLMKSDFRGKKFANLKKGHSQTPLGF